MINCIPFRKACTGLPEGMHLISEKCALCKRNIQETPICSATSSWEYLFSCRNVVKLRAILFFCGFILFTPPKAIISLGFRKFHQPLQAKYVMIGCITAHLFFDTCALLEANPAPPAANCIFDKDGPARAVSKIVWGGHRNHLIPT